VRSSVGSDFLVVSAGFLSVGHAGRVTHVTWECTCSLVASVRCRCQSEGNCV
jgi:hypothetical protein